MSKTPVVPETKTHARRRSLLFLGLACVIVAACTTREGDATTLTSTPAPTTTAALAVAPTVATTIATTIAPSVAPTTTPPLVPTENQTTPPESTTGTPAPSAASGEAKADATGLPNPIDGTPVTKHPLTGKQYPATLPGYYDYQTAWSCPIETCDIGPVVSHFTSRGWVLTSGTSHKSIMSKGSKSLIVSPGTDGVLEGQLLVVLTIY